MACDFEIKSLGELWYFLGLEVVECPNGRMLCQKKYVMDDLKAFDIHDCKVIKIPMEKNANLGGKKENHYVCEKVIAGVIDLKYVYQT